MFSRQKFQSGQYHNESVISGMLFYHNPGHSIICLCSSFIIMYLPLVKTGMDLRNKHKKIMFGNDQFIMILADVWEIFGREALEVYLKGITGQM